MKTYFVAVSFLLVISCQPKHEPANPGASDKLSVDFRYQPREWQTCYGLVDDFYKSMIADDGSLWYDFRYGTNHIGFPYTNFCWERNKGYRIAVFPRLIRLGYPSDQSQAIESPRLPIVINDAKYGNMAYQQSTFASFSDVANPLDSRYDICRIEVKNEGKTHETARVRVEINTTFQMELDESRKRAYLVLYGEDNQLLIEFPVPVERFAGHLSKMKYTYYFDFPGILLEPSAQDEFTFVVYRSKPTPQVKFPVDFEKEKNKAVTYWKETEFPYNVIKVPDEGIQRLLYSCIRNIYQAREIKEGVPAFQVGPTFYRGTWAVDGPFFMEAMTYLGQQDEVRQAVEGIFIIGETQGDTGESFSKQAGLRLWMIWRHAQLTGDYNWLKKMWLFIRQEVNNIKQYRKNSYEDGSPLTNGMMPMGNSDGGIGGIYAEYTNNYWVLSGLKMAIKAAKHLEKNEHAAEWQQLFDEYFRAFNNARERDKKKDQYGNNYVPVFMQHNTLNPTTGQWAFMHSVFPGKLYDKNDTLMRGTLAMLDSNLVEGLILGTGWLPKGLWTYSASFHGHAHLWLGNGYRIPQILYDFANHASPLLCWSEEQYPADYPGDYLAHGDMPHNWASVDFIRLIRHSLALERANELHLFEGLPKQWLEPGMRTEFNGVNTTFGKLTFILEVNKKGQKANLALKLDKNTLVDFEGFVIHQQAFNSKEELIHPEQKDSISIQLDILN